MKELVRLNVLKCLLGTDENTFVVSLLASAISIISIGVGVTFCIAAAALITVVALLFRDSKPVAALTEADVGQCSVGSAIDAANAACSTFGFGAVDIIGVTATGTAIGVGAAVSAASAAVVIHVALLGNGYVQRGTLL